MLVPFYKATDYPVGLHVVRVLVYFIFQIQFSHFMMLE